MPGMELTSRPARPQISVRVAAGRICEDLATLRQAQQSLAASLEAFRPYASVSQEDVTDCARDTQPKTGSAPAP